MKIEKIVTFAVVLAVIALTVGLAGCERTASMLPDPQKPPVMDTEIPIGVVLALTGQHAEPYGRQE